MMHKRSTSCFRSAALIAALGFSLVLAAGAEAQPAPTLLWSYPGIENVVSCGWSQDIDGDGGPDVLFESYDSGAPATDHMFAIRGRSSGTGTVIWSARPLGGPSNSGGYGDNCLRNSPDLDGDGFPEVLLGCAWGSRTAFALNGRTGVTEWRFDTYAQSPPTPPASGWIYAMDSLGSDLTGDGVPEVVFCAGSDNNGIYCVNGRTGAEIWFYLGGDAFMDIISIDDLNGDGVRDVIAGGVDNVPGVFALSGVGNGAGGGRLLWSRTSGAVQDVARLQDITGDGIPEVVTAAWDNFVHCYNGATGLEVWPGSVGDYAMRVAILDDVNGDGVQDVAVGSWANAAVVMSGTCGCQIWRTPVGTLNGGDVWAIDRVGDVTGDGKNDVCCGSFDTYVYLMNGVTGAIVWKYGTGNRLYTVRGVPDISGNGTPDVVAGTQKLTTGGICYALEGGPDLTAVPDGSGSWAVRLSPGFPNPFTSATAWDLQVSQPGNVEVSLFGPAGSRITTLRRGDPADMGQLHISWDGRDAAGRPAPAGVYYARILYNGRPAGERKAVLIR